MVRLYILERPYRALFLAAEEHEADCPSRQKPSCLNRARRFNHKCRVAAVVERSRAQLPRIQMCAEDDDFIRLLVAPNFAHNVFLSDGPANLVGHVEARAHLPWIGRGGPCKSHGIFARHNGLRNPVNFTGQ